MHKYIRVFLHHRLNYHIGGFQDSGNELEVSCSLKRLMIRCRILEILRLLNDIIHFFEGFGDSMDIVNIAKDDFGVFIIVACFESAIFETVCLRIHFRSCIVNDNPGIAHYGFLHVSCLTYFLDHDLVFHGSIVHNTLHALRRSPDRAARLLVIVAQGWQPVFSPKSRTCQNLFEADLSRENQLFGVRVTNFVVVVLGDHLEVVCYFSILGHFEV